MKPTPTPAPLSPGRPGPPTSVLGLGDAIKRVTTAVGIKPCKGCEKRAKRLNRLFPLGQRKRE
jgi:hypothetical protein